MDARLVTSQTEIPASVQADMVAEANHRIANSLALLVSMVRMQARFAVGKERLSSIQQCRNPA